MEEVGDCLAIWVLEGGIQGDRYQGKIGAWSKVRVDVPRDVSLIEAEVIEVVQAELGVSDLARLTRRNFVTRGIRLNDLVGRRFRIGENGPLLEGVEPCDPCARPGKLSGIEALNIGLEAALRGRGGLRAKVIETGLITPGDSITVL